MFPVWERQN